MIEIRQSQELPSLKITRVSIKLKKRRNVFLSCLLNCKKKLMKCGNDLSGGDIT